MYKKESATLHHHRHEAASKVQVCPSDDVFGTHRFMLIHDTIHARSPGGSTSPGKQSLGR
jgi:hypothetical protein